MAPLRIPFRSARRATARWRSAGCALAAGWLFSACCVSPPLVDEWMKVGFKAPVQTIETFQTAVRADAPDLEYRCFSAGFRRRNHISKLTWREAREKLRSDYPWMRRGLSDMSVEGTVRVEGDRALLVCVTHGQHFRVGFVREDFAELWSGERLLSDDPDVDFDRHTMTQKDAEGHVWFYGCAVVPGVDPDVTEVRVGREWKIDSFESVEDDGDMPLGQDASQT
jgi:hypothetical protein